MRGLLVLSVLLLAGCGSNPLGEHLGDPELFGRVKAVHNIQAWSDEILKDQTYANGVRWMGNNPRIHGEIGLEWEHKIECPVLVAGTSVFVGAPLKQNKPELYWATLECGWTWGGK